VIILIILVISMAVEPQKKAEFFYPHLLYFVFRALREVESRYYFKTL